MPLSDARWKSITESQYPWEREALEFIRQGLPDHEPYRAWSNFEFIAESGAIYEVDLLVITPKGFFLVEIKSRPGSLEGDTHTWTWTQDGRRHSYDNPLILTDRKAKRLKSLIARQKALKKIRVPFLQPLVFCSAEDLEFRLSPGARQGVYLRDREATSDRPARAGIAAALTRWTPGTPDDPGNRRIDRPMAKALARALEEAGVRPSQRSRRVGDYILGDLINEGPGYQDWEAKHAALENVRRRVRLYPVAMGTTEEGRKTHERAARREFQILEGIHHPGILRAVDYREHERGPAVIFEHDPKSITLDHFLLQRGGQLSVDVRMDLLRQLAEALRYAHEKKLIHRALSPGSVLVLDSDAPHPRIQVFNWQTGAREEGTSTSMPGVTGTVHVPELVDERSLVYLAPEVVAGMDGAGEYADVFSLGALAYCLFSGKAPANTLAELAERLRQTKGLQISSVLDGAGSNLQTLIHWSTQSEVSSRLDTVDGFLELLQEVEEELTAPDEEEVADPVDARANDRLEGGFVVKKRLGKGSVAVALLVERNGEESVLKVANAIDNNDRLRDEAEVLEKLRHPNVVPLKANVQMGDRVGFLVEKAGDETLAQRLRSEGRLHLEHLQRFGEDLLETVDYLEQQGIPHRDIKPDNIGVTALGREKKLHLVLFDFSLSRMPPENVRAGTRPYLDPFLSLRKPARWDLDAERFAAAMTLYEMTTGTLPKWGDGQSDPALLDCEATLDTELFDPDLREPLTEFFSRALRRDHRKRFDNCEEMLRSWRRIFETGTRPTHETDVDRESDLDGALEQATPATQIALLPLSTRALNALDRLNIVVVSDLLKQSVVDLYRLRGVGNKTRREIGEVFGRLSSRFPDEVARIEKPGGTKEEAEHPDSETPSVDLLAAQLLPTRARADSSEPRVLRLLLGLDEMPSAKPTGWPSQTDVAKHLDLTRARIGQVVGKARKRWAKSSSFTRLRQDVGELLESNAGVMTSEELTSAVIATRGSARVEPFRAKQALAVVRAAVETERDLTEPRFLVRRSSDLVLVALSQELADYAERLGRAADELAQSDPLVAPTRVLETLHEVRGPDGAALSDARLVQLAAAASASAAVSGRLEIYPRDMEARRSLRLAYGAVLGARELKVAEIRNRVKGRYPAAAELPGRPQLDELIREAGWDFRWSAEGSTYVSSFAAEVTTSGSSSLERYATTQGELPAVTPDVADARQFEERLRHAVDNGAFLALTARPRDLRLAEKTLASHFPVERRNLDEILIGRMRAQAEELRVDWDTVLEADTAGRESGDWRNLLRLVARAVSDVENELLHSEKTVLLVYPGLLARYDQINLIDRLHQSVGQHDGLPGLWLLVPSGMPTAMPMIDGKPVPVITPGQWAPIPEPWLQNVHRAAKRKTEALEPYQPEEKEKSSGV